MADDQTKLAEKIRRIKSKEGDTTTVISEDDNEVMPKETKFPRRTAGIPNLQDVSESQFLAANRKDDESYIRVSCMGSVFRSSKKELLRKLNNWKPSGSFGLIVGQTCKPIKKNYAENTHFETVTQLLNVPDKKRVTLCKDKETEEEFVRKQIVKTIWNKNEAVVPLNMDHGNIAQIIGILQRDDGLNIWMELLFEKAGLSLERFLQKKYPLSQIEFLEVSSGVLEGLSYLHLHNIIHHDIKPQNICIAEKGKLHPKLIDFGAAKLPHQAVTVKDWTPEYMAPECCNYFLSKDKNQDAAGITTKVDMFSFSMVCGYMKTKRHLLMALWGADGKGNKGNRIAVIKKMAENGERIITSIIDGIKCDAGTQKLIQQMASFCPDTRLSAEEALKRVKELAKQYKAKQPTQTTSMTEETEMESCGVAKKARFSAKIVHDISLFKRTNQQMELEKLNEFKKPHQTAISTEESEVERYSDAKKARVSEFTNQNERKGEQSLRHALMTEESEVESCSGGKTARLLGLAKLKESKQPPQAAGMTKAAAVESCSDPKKAHVSESPKGTERTFFQSPRDSPTVQYEHGNDVMKPPDDCLCHTVPGFRGQLVDKDGDNKNKQGNIPTFEQIDN